jgi:hypothetical protein
VRLLLREPLGSDGQVRCDRHCMRPGAGVGSSRPPPPPWSHPPWSPPSWSPPPCPSWPLGKRRGHGLEVALAGRPARRPAVAHLLDIHHERHRPRLVLGAGPGRERHGLPGAASPALPPLDLDAGDPVAAAYPSNRLCHPSPLLRSPQPGAPTPARESAPAVAKETGDPAVIPQREHAGPPTTSPQVRGPWFVPRVGFEPTLDGV